MEGLGPHHSKIKERAKTSYIWTTGEGGGGGGGGGGQWQKVKSSPSILSKIAITDRINWNSQQIYLSPEIEDEAPQKPKCAAFPSLIWVRRGC